MLEPMERNVRQMESAIEHGAFILKNLAALDFASPTRQVEQIAQEYDKEEWHREATALGIDGGALKALDACRPPVPYPYYFCTPDILTQHPELVTYYRNVAMVSQREMHGMGLDAVAYEAGEPLIPDLAAELARRFNRIVSSVLVAAGQVTPQLHVEMACLNLGISLGNLWRKGWNGNGSEREGADKPA